MASATGGMFAQLAVNFQAVFDFVAWLPSYRQGRYEVRTATVPGFLNLPDKACHGPSCSTVTSL